MMESPRLPLLHPKLEEPSGGRDLGRVAGGRARAERGRLRTLVAWLLLLGRASSRTRPSRGRVGVWRAVSSEGETRADRTEAFLCVGQINVSSQPSVASKDWRKYERDSRSIHKSMEMSFPCCTNMDALEFLGLE